MVGHAQQYHLGLAAAVLRTTHELVDALDARRLHGLAGQRRLGRLLGGPTSLSFQAGYERYDDAVYRDGSARGVFGLVRLKVVSF